MVPPAAFWRVNVTLPVLLFPAFVEKENWYGDEESSVVKRVFASPDAAAVTFETQEAGSSTETVKVPDEFFFIFSH